MDMLLSDKCSKWLQRLDPDFDTIDQSDYAHDTTSTNDFEDDIDTLGVQDISEYRNLVRGSPAYSWLMDCIRRNTSLCIRKDMSLTRRPQMATVTPLADLIFDSLPSPSEISRGHRVAPICITYHVAWNPTAFFEEQGHHNKASDLISKIITLTGLDGDVQASTTEQYLSQTWPFSGIHFLRAIASALRQYEEYSATEVSADTQDVQTKSCKHYSSQSPAVVAGIS